MNVAELRLEDSYGRMIVIGKFAGQITIRPIAGKIGDALALDRHQAHLLLLYLQEHVPPPVHFPIG
jgi:hypothetical protein